MITFEGIRRIYEEEKRKHGELSKLPENLFSEVKQYIVNRQQAIREGENRDELDTAKRRLESVFEMRERKIINSALDFVRTEAEPLNLLEEEDALFRKIVSDIEKFRDEMSNLLRFVNKEEKKLTPDKDASQEKSEESQIKAQKTENEIMVSDETKKENKSSDNVKIVMVDVTADVHEFMGTDMKTYGPFKRGEIATVPEENALVIKRTGKGEIIREQA